MNQRSVLKRFMMIMVFLFLLAAPVAWALSMSQDGLSGGTVSNTIRGTASLSGGTAVQNARIVAQKLSGGTVYEAFTDASGAYTLTVPTGAATWRVSAESTNTTTPTGAQPPGSDRLVVFNVGGPYEKTGVDFTFSLPDAQIVGRVMIHGSPDFAPSFPVTVTAFSPIHSDVSTLINPDGTFTVTVAAGVYEVSFRAASTVYRPPRPVRKQVDAGQTWDLGIVYLESIGGFATISGQVLIASSSQPAPNAPVMAVPLETTWPPVTGESLGSAEIVHTDANGVFTHSVRAGMWWIAVDIGDPAQGYLPYRDSWQTIVTIGPLQTITNTQLFVEAADSHILGTLTDGVGGPQAADACGLVATYKAQDIVSTVYNFRRFEGGVFDLPVISGTYRLAVQPNPDIDRLLNALPQPPALQAKVQACASGKYLVATEPHIVVGAQSTVPITIPLATADVTIHAILWDVAQDQALTGWDGQVIGWSEGNWTATAVYTPTGSGDLTASAGTWLLAYRVDENSGYESRPGVWGVQIPTGTVEVTVTLPVFHARAVISGTVRAPDGAPVAGAPVSAINISPVSVANAGLAVGDGDATITDQNGNYTLYLDYGAYQVTAFRPPDWRDNNASQAWISPEPQRVLLTPQSSAQQVNLQFRNGDAVIHGRLSLGSAFKTMGLPSGFQMPAIVWAGSTSGRTYTQAPMPMNPGEEYSLPAFQGEQWLVGAAFVDISGETVWITETVVTVDAADVPLDLILTDSYTSLLRVAQTADPNQPFISELINKIHVSIPAGALPAGGRVRTFVEEVQPGRILMDLYANLSPEWQGSFCDLFNVCWNTGASGGNNAGMRLLTAPVRIGVENALGQAQTGPINTPMVIRIPYHTAGLAQMSLHSAAAPAPTPYIQPLYYDELMGGWQPVDDYVVDSVNNEVVIFSDQMGVYALVSFTSASEVYLPVVMRN